MMLTAASEERLRLAGIAGFSGAGEAALLEGLIRSPAVRPAELPATVLRALVPQAP